MNTLTTTKGASRDTGKSITSDTPTTLSSTSSDTLVDVDHSDTILIKTYITASVTAVTNSAGLPTSTSTMVSSAIVPTPTATSDLAPPITIVLTNSDGAATKTVAFDPIPTTPPIDEQHVFISTTQYFIGFCLPKVLTVLVAMPIRALNMNAKLFQPWHELTESDGAFGHESFNLPTSGFNSCVNGLLALRRGQMVISLTSMLIMCSVLLVPLSAETFVLQLRCNCGVSIASECTLQLRVSEIPAKAAVVLLAFMCVLVILIIGFLWRWKSGVYTNPWSICGMAGHSQNRDIKALFTQGMKNGDALRNDMDDALRDECVDRRFKLDWFYNGGDKLEHGITLRHRHSETEHQYTALCGAQEEGHSEHNAKYKNCLPFMLSVAGSLLFLSVLLGLLALISYYISTSYVTGFEKFMDSESFGTKFLFTSIGTIITLFWSSFVSSKLNSRSEQFGVMLTYTGVAMISPYQSLSKRPQVAKYSILLSPPTNALSSISSGFCQRHLLLIVVGITALLSEFLTIFLSNVPYRIISTLPALLICNYGSISILAVMALVVIASLFVKWPYMPADPSTIAGSMYYVCDSWMLRDFEHFSVMDKCNKRANAIGQSYKMGEFVGQTGVARIGVNAVSDKVCV